MAGARSVVFICIYIYIYIFPRLATILQTLNNSPLHFVKILKNYTKNSKKSINTLKTKKFST